MMKNKLISLLLIFSLIGILSSCQEEEYIVADEGEILDAAERLLSESVLWNEIFFIEGFEIKEGGITLGSYREVDPLYLEKIGMKSVDEIKRYASRIFSSDMLSRIEETVFGAVHGTDGSIGSVSVCFDYTEKRGDEDVFLCVMVDPRESPRYHADHVIYLLDTMRVTYNRNHEARVELTVQNQETNAEKKYTVQLIRENGSWYLNYYTFVIFGKQ